MNEIASVRFFERCVPPMPTHQSKRIVTIAGHGHLADTPRLTAAKSFWDSLFLPHRPTSMLYGPVRMHIMLMWPWRASDSKRVRAPGWAWYEERPDPDNIGKTIADSLARCGYFLDDKRLSSYSVDRFRGDTPGVVIELESLPSPGTVVLHPFSAYLEAG